LEFSATRHGIDGTKNTKPSACLELVQGLMLYI